jgi:RNA polymerase sigma-70 factor (ECF subfamily)
LISRIIPDKDIAEEVLKETFIAIHSRVGVYSAAHNRFLTWGLAIARGVALEAVRTGKYNHLAQSSNGATMPAEGMQEQVLPGGENSRKAFCLLEPQERAIIDLVYFKGRSCTETAAELGITIEALRESLVKAIIHLGSEKAK